MSDRMKDDAAIVAAVQDLPALEKEIEGWTRTPILDDWRWQWGADGQLYVVGQIYGHDAVGGGKKWVTEFVTAIDPKGRYVEDSNKAVYRLGWPRHGEISSAVFWPPILYVATRGNLDAAAREAMKLTGGHTLPGEFLGYLDAAYAEDATPQDRRNGADRVAEALFRQNRNSVAAAWVMLASDVTNVGARVAVGQSVEWAVRDVERERERECTTAETLVANGWKIIGTLDNKKFDYLVGLARLGVHDQVVLARTVADLAELMLASVGRSLLSPWVRVDDEDLIVRDDEPEGAIVVLREIGLPTTEKGREAKKVLEPLLGKALSPAKVPNLDAVGAALRAEFPYAAEQVDVVLSDLVGTNYVRFRPSIFIGPAGGGKTTLARRLPEAVGLHVTHYDAGSASDSSFGGTARRWSTGEPSVPLRAMIAARSPTAAIVVDEIEKCGTGTQNGNFAFSLLGFIEPETARRYPDPYVDAPVDCSRVSYLATANDVTKLPAMLRDRFRIVRIPPPRREDLPALAQTIVANLARESGSDPRWFLPPLSPDEIDIADQLWKGNRSLRRLREIVARILVHRADAPRH